MKNRKIWELSALCVVLALLLACTPGTTPTPTSKPVPSPTSQATTALTPTPKSPTTSTAAPVSFAGKTITIVVCNTAGGGVDIMARLYARHLGRLLPGKPAVIVRNMPGGAYTIGANYVYASKPNGLTLLCDDSGSAMSYLTGASGVHYDMTKMEAVLSHSEGAYYYARPSIVNKAEDLPKAKGIIYGGSSASPGWIFVASTRVLDIHPAKVVLAYTGGADSRRAFYAGETNMSHEGYKSYLSGTAEYVATGEVTVLFQTGLINERGEIVRDPGTPLDIPTGKELYEKIYGKPPSGVAWDAYKALVAVGRTYISTLFLRPGMPDDIVRSYWNAAEKMLQDPQVQKDIELFTGVANSPWMAGEACSKAFRSNITIDPKVMDWLKGVLLEYGVVLS